MRTRLQFESYQRGSRKAQMWVMRSTQTRHELGTVVWGSSRGYRFWPRSAFALDEQQLEELLCFVRARTAERAAGNARVKF